MHNNYLFKLRDDEEYESEQNLHVYRQHLMFLVSFYGDVLNKSCSLCFNNRISQNHLLR